MTYLALSFQHSALSLMLSASLFALGATLQGRANFFMDDAPHT